MSNNTDRKTQQQRRSSTESFVLDSGASGTYYPTAFDEESPNDGSNRRSQGSSEIVIAAFKEEFNRLISAGAIVEQHERPALQERIVVDGRIRQTYARYTTHVRPEQPSPTRIRLSAAGNRIRHIDISSNYCHTHAQDVSHNSPQCLNFSNLSVAEQRRIS